MSEPEKVSKAEEIPVSSPTPRPRGRPKKVISVTQSVNTTEESNKTPRPASKAESAATKPVSFRRRDVLEVLNKNGKYRYYWGIFDRVRAWGGQHRSGWRVLTTLNKTEEDILAEHGFNKSQFVDGCIRVNEMVLMFMPMEEWLELRKYKRSLRDEQIKSIKHRGRQRHTSTEYTMERGGKIIDSYKDNLIER